MHSLQRVDEPKPADERLLGAIFRAKSTADRLAIEVQFQVYAEHTTVDLGAGLLFHYADRKRASPLARRGAP